jgi:hypothetical protein
VSAETTALITVFVILQIKHFIFDYPLQTAYHLRNKGTYGHPGGILHSGLHILGTSAIFLVVTPSLPLAAVILGGEFVLHYHIDWSKDHITRWIRATAHDRTFWWAIGFDQLLHHLTYVAIAVVLVRYGTY